MQTNTICHQAYIGYEGAQHNRAHDDKGIQTDVSRRTYQPDNKRDCTQAQAQIDIRHKLHFFQSLEIPNREEAGGNQLCKSYPAKKFVVAHEWNGVNAQGEHRTAHNDDSGFECEYGRYNPTLFGYVLFGLNNRFSAGRVDTKIQQNLKDRSNREGVDIRAVRVFSGHTNDVRVNQYADKRTEDTQRCHEGVVLQHARLTQSLPCFLHKKFLIFFLLSQRNIVARIDESARSRILGNDPT